MGSINICFKTIFGYFDTHINHDPVPRRWLASCLSDTPQTSEGVFSDTFAMKSLKNNKMNSEDKIVAVETPVAADKPSKTGHSDTESQGFSPPGIQVNLETRFNNVHHPQSAPSYSHLSNLPALLRSITKVAEESDVPVQEVCVTECFSKKMILMFN